MIVESAQLLCNVYSLRGILAPYKPTHVNHPCSKWANESRANLDWLIEHAIELCHEKRLRFRTMHSTEAVVKWCQANAFMLEFKTTGLTAFAQATPEIYKQANAVEAYRAYYKTEKVSSAQSTNQ